MPKLWRHIIFFLFVLIFFVSAPLIVLHTAGYRYHFATGSIVQTGVLSIASSPRSARIVIDGKATSKKTPHVFDNMFPGEHRIELQKDGYASWTKSVTVQSRETAFATEAVLFLQNDPMPADQLELISAQVSPNKETLVYLQKTKTFAELRRTQENTQVSELLLRVTYDPNAHYEIHWSQDNQHVLFDVVRGPLHELTLVNVSNGLTTTIDIHERIANYWWDPGDTNHLYVLGRFSLKDIHVANGEQERLEHTSVTRRFDEERIWLTPSQNQVALTTSTEGDRSRILAYVPWGTYRFVHSPSHLVMVHDSNRDRLVLIDPKAQQPILFQAEATQWDWNANLQLLAFSNGFEVQILDTETGELHTVTRSSDLFDSLLWHPNHDLLLIEQNQQLFVTEFIGSEKNQTELATQFDLEHIWFSNGTDNVFLMNGEGMVLYRPLQD